MEGPYQGLGSGFGLGVVLQGSMALIRVEGV